MDEEVERPQSLAGFLRGQPAGQLGSAGKIHVLEQDAHAGLVFAAADPDALEAVARVGEPLGEEDPGVGVAGVGQASAGAGREAVMGQGLEEFPEIGVADGVNGAAAERRGRRGLSGRAGDRRSDVSGGLLDRSVQEPRGRGPILLKKAVAVRGVEHGLDPRGSGRGASEHARLGGVGVDDVGPPLGEKRAELTEGPEVVERGNLARHLRHSRPLWLPRSGPGTPPARRRGPRRPETPRSARGRGRCRSRRPARPSRPVRRTRRPGKP